MELFGWEITKNKSQEKIEPVKSPVPKIDSDGATIVEKNWSPGGIDAYSVSANFDATAGDEVSLITKYREIAQVPVVDFAIDDIINEMMSIEKNNDIVEIDLDELEWSDGLKEKVTNEFTNVLKKLDFNNSAYEIARRWYEDGRLNYQVLIDPDASKAKIEGIQELRYIDPRTIKKIKEIKNESGRGSTILQSIVNEYFIFSPTGFSSTTPGVNSTGVRLSKESVVYITSGIMNHNNTMVLSFLHKAIRPLNQLRAMEDSALIYRISRAAEKRIFYIDVGNLPTAKATQHIQSIAASYKNKVTYDQGTGEIRDDRKFMTMTEDYFLPRRSDGRATEITTLAGGQNLGEMEEVNYFLNQLYRALNVPLTRLDSTSTFQFGRQTEISRDEVKFAKFISRIRKRFSQLFVELLGKQLVLKNIITPEDYDKIKNYISFEFSADNLFAENKEMEILSARLDNLERLKDYTGIYYSKEYIQRNVLRMSQEDMDEMNKQIEQEKKKQYLEDDLRAQAIASNEMGIPEEPDGTSNSSPVKSKPPSKTPKSKPKPVEK